MMTKEILDTFRPCRQRNIIRQAFVVPADRVGDAMGAAWAAGWQIKSADRGDAAKNEVMIVCEREVEVFEYNPSQSTPGSALEKTERQAPSDAPS